MDAMLAAGLASPAGRPSPPAPAVRWLHAGAAAARKAMVKMVLVEFMLIFLLRRFLLGVLLLLFPSGRLFLLADRWGWIRGCLLLLETVPWACLHDRGSYCLAFSRWIRRSG